MTPNEPPPVPESDDLENTGMTLIDHLDELRRRLLIALVAMGVTTAASFWLSENVIFPLLTRPIGGAAQLQSIEVTENVGVFMRISLLGGVTLAMPVLVYELLAFVAPGLTKNERMWVLIAVPMTTLLFLCGAAFAYFVMLPAAIPFLLDFMGVHTVPRLSNYINFTTSLIFWLGVSFESPLLIFVLAKMKLVNARSLLKGWRIAIVVISVIAAVVTPTVDPVNMLLLMAPLFVLYLFSVLLAALA